MPGRDVVLFVTHAKSRCGVYEFGRNVFTAIRASGKYEFIYAECDGMDALMDWVDRTNPRAAIYNYMPATMPWLTTLHLRRTVRQSHVAGFPFVQIGIIHSVLQEIADAAQPRREFMLNLEPANRLFDYYLAPDPTITLRNPYVFTHGRPLQRYVNRYAAPAMTTIGSFGFAKIGYVDLIRQVQAEFDDAEIRLSIPFAAFGDPTGEQAKEIADRCRQLVQKPGIMLTIQHEYLGNDALLDFLAQNTVNVFLRDDTGRGISSVIDYALAVDRPIAISASRMFRHVLEASPSICLATTTLRQIIQNGTGPLATYRRAWTPENLCIEYERMLDLILKRSAHPRPAFDARVEECFLGAICRLTKPRHKTGSLPRRNHPNT